jgi:hypothetical protein
MLSHALVLVVDHLPSALWSPHHGILLGHRLHFCVGSGEHGGMVRTVEWRGRERVRGKREFED